MPRIRTIKPEFFRSLAIHRLGISARLTFIGLWTHVDDEGRELDEPRLIKAAVWPLDEDHTAADVEQDLKELEAAGRIVRYEHAGQRIVQVVNWHEHQRIDRPTPSRYPPPAEHPGPAQTSAPRANAEPSANAHGALVEASLPEREQGRGTGKGSSPPPYIPPPQGEPEASSRASGGAADAATAQALLGEHITRCDRRPPSRVVGQLGREIGQLLAEGFEDGVIAAALERLRAKGLHPATLPSLVNGEVNGDRAPPGEVRGLRGAAKGKAYAEAYRRAADEARRQGR